MPGYSNPHRYCPVCGKDTNRTGHAPGCLMANRDPEFRPVRGGPLGIGMSLAVIFWLLVFVVVVSWLGQWPAVWSFVHSLAHNIAPGVVK